MGTYKRTTSDMNLKALEMYIKDIEMVMAQIGDEHPCYDLYVRLWGDALDELEERLSVPDKLEYELILQEEQIVKGEE